MRRVLTGFLTLTALAVTACSSGPEAIRWGTDSCSLCRMVISDHRFVAEFVNQGGRAEKFDGVDELARYLSQQARQGTAYVGDGDSGELIKGEAASYLHSPELRAPMGGHLMSFATAAAAQAYATQQHLSQPRVLRYAEALQQQREDDARGGR